MKKTRKSLLLCLFLFVISLVLAISACGETKQVKFEFDTAGGETIEAITLEVGDEYTLPTPVWNNAHEFVGWYTDSEYSGSPVTTVTAETNTTFYAKWETLAEITLDLGGGSLAEASGGKLYLKAGNNLYAFMQAYAPTKADAQFGRWLVGETALARTAVMPAEGITLTAEYKVAYTVETYLQNLSQNGYERGEDIIGYEYAGTNYTPDPVVEGFDVVSNDNAEMTKVLSGTASENVYKFYFDRQSLSVVFFSNYPTASGMESATESRSVLYGAELQLSVEFASPAGYCLVGWSRTANGEVVYGAGYIERRLYGSEETGTEGISVDTDLMLYAVWSRGYTDLFGGKDYVYIFEDEAVAYFERGGVFFKGEYNERRETFTFRDGNNKVLLEGVLRADGTYTYYDAARGGAATLFKFGSGIDENTTVYFDEYDNITYSVKDAFGMTTQSEGSYRFDESGYYVAKFTSGELKDTEITFDVGYANDEEGVSRKVFQIRNDDEYNLGKIVSFFVVDGGISYYTEAYHIVLNGFGIAGLYGESDYTYYYYLKDGDVVRLYDANFSLYKTEKLMTVNGITGYMIYDSKFDVTFTSDSGATLKLDGTCNATYTNGNTVVTGYYELANSAFGGNLIRVTTSEGIFTFYGTEETEGENTVYSFVERPSSYIEFYFKNEEQDTYYYYSPLITLDETGEGEINVYGISSDSSSTITYVKVASGTYRYDEDSGAFHATLTEHTAAEVHDMPVDLTGVNSFVFKAAVVTVKEENRYVSYWYSLSTDEGTTSFETVYHEEGGEATLTLVATFATYDKDGTPISGSYVIEDGILYMLVPYNGSVVYLRFEINEDEHTFVYLSDIFGTAYAMLEDGTVSTAETIFFNGKGGIIYTVGEGEDAVTYTGTYEVLNETTAFNSKIYEFRSDERTFRFILVSGSSATYFARYSETYHGVYTHDADTLELDGFGYTASYTVNRTANYGVYYVYDENVICMILTNGETLYFDLDDGSFTLRGSEFGKYLIYDNLGLSDLFLSLNGYGELTILGAGENEEDDLAELAVGDYGVTEDGYYELVYELDGARVTWLGTIGQVVIDSRTYNTFFVLREEVVRSYVNETDWSVLMLDGFGNATKINKLGQKEDGSYLLITDSLLYYFNAEGTDASIYVYDKAKGTATPVVFDQIGYYTKDLESLLFTNYGFMVMGGSTRYYYNVVNGNVLVYHRAAEGETGNEFGFVEENFGPFVSSIEWKGKTYFQNSGYALLFRRAQEGQDDYKVRLTSSDSEKYALEDLTFTPSGGTEFSVKGSVTINGKNYTGTATRSVDEEGEVTMTFTVGNIIFTIEVDYRGEREDGTSDNTYVITAMRTELLLPSWTYLYLYYLYAQIGSSINNSIGIMCIVNPYGTDGEPIEGAGYVDGAFGSVSGMTDSNGKLVSFEKAPYTYSSQNGLYTVEFTAEDGYVYRVHFSVSNNFVNVFGYYSYQLYAFTRVETLDLGDGYSVEIERVMTTENKSVREGGLYSVRLYHGEDELTLENVFMLKNTLYCIVKGEEENGCTSVTYYVIELVENIPEGVEGEEGAASGTDYYTYLSATLTIKSVYRYTYGDQTFVDFDAQTDDVLLIVYDNTGYMAESTNKDDNGRYIVTCISGDKFYVEKDGTIGMLSDTEEGEEDKT